MSDRRCADLNGSGTSEYTVYLFDVGSLEIVGSRILQVSLGVVGWKLLFL